MTIINYLNFVGYIKLYMKLKLLNAYVNKIF